MFDSIVHRYGGKGKREPSENPCALKMSRDFSLECVEELKCSILVSDASCFWNLRNQILYNTLYTLAGHGNSFYWLV